MNKAQVLEKLLSDSAFATPTSGVAVLQAAASLLTTVGDDAECAIEYQMGADGISVHLKFPEPEPEDEHLQIPALAISDAELERIKNAVIRLVERVKWLRDMTHGELDDEVAKLFAAGVFIADMLVGDLGAIATQAEQPVVALPVDNGIPF